MRGLLDLAPEQATRLTASGEEEVVDTAELVVGDVVLVRPGERVGADGEVLEGLSEVDQATITGEPLPAVKAVGDEVFAGTLNGTGALRVRVNRAAEDSVVARIVTMVEEASETKARTQLFIEKVEQRYSVGMVVATLAVFAVPLAFGAAFEPTLLRAMTFMIVASPCAVVLATMPPLLSAIANAGRHGVLVKSAVALEELGKTDLVAFDKTGTLTEGTPRVSEIEPAEGAGLTKERLLALAAAAERPSEHPLARAVVAAAHELDVVVPHSEEFGSTPGLGVTARSRASASGSARPALLDDLPGAAPRRSTEARALVSELEEAGRTAVAVVADGVPVGVLALADRVRPGAREVVSALRTMTGHSPILLTGDNERAARRLAEEVGITEVRAGLLPDAKVAEIRRLQAEGRRVLLVGDGVNDAPAMAAAEVGVAMGRHGSDLALETADAVDRPRRARHLAQGHRPVPASPPRRQGQPGLRRRDDHRPGGLGRLLDPPAAARRRRPRGLHDGRRPQRAAPPAALGVAEGGSGTRLRPARRLARGSTHTTPSAAGERKPMGCSRYRRAPGRRRSRPSRARA